MVLLEVESFGFNVVFELSAWTELFFLPVECGVRARGALGAGPWQGWCR